MKFRVTCNYFLRWVKDSSAQFFLIMKLTTVLILITCLHVSAKVSGQKITFHKNKASLEDVFNVIRKQTGFEFLYNDYMIGKASKEDVSFNDLPLNAALNELFKDQPLTYTIVGKTIIVKEKKIAEDAIRADRQPAQRKITGLITDSTTGNPLIGVSVQIVGTSLGTATDKDGKFSLTVSKDAVLRVSYVGYNSKDIAIKEQSNLYITLSTSSTPLEELVVIGYGTQRKKDLTGAISSLNTKDLQKENPTSVQDLLRANIPGLSIGLNTAAKPGGSLHIRGTNSLTAGTSPLIVVDGTIYYGALADINPQDVATIDVLKGASAAAVYGAKAANGVIVISTKKGKKGKPVINFNANYSVATMEVNQPVYQGQAFVDWRTDVENSIHGFSAQPYQFNDPRKLPEDISIDQWLAYDASSGDPVDVWLRRLNFNPIEITDYKKGAVTNWYDEVFQNGVQHNYTLSLSGGTDKFNYHWSAGYLNNEGIVVGQKYSTVQSRLKIEGKVTKFLTVGINTAFSDRDESSVPFNWNLISQASPYGSMWNSDTTGYSYSPQDDYKAALNPYYHPGFTDRLKKYFTLNSIIYGKVTLPFGITYNVNFTPEFEWYQYFNENSALDQGYALLGGSAERDQHQIYQWQLDNIIHWNRTFNGDHRLEVTLLANAEKYQYWENNMQTNGFDPSDVLSYHNFAAGSNPVITSDDEYSTQAAYMARVFYSFKDRYLLTLSMRRDGNSAFGQKYPWSNFPAVAGGWVFTKEPFFKAKWLDFGKLRFSYGVNGNSSIGRYSALSNLTTGKYLEVAPDGTVNVVSQLWVNRMQNKNLQWERTSAFNLGLDFAMIDNKISGSIDLYKNKTTNLLVDRALPDMSGFTDIETNLGQVDNKGLEISLTSKNINNPNFTWNTSFNFSLNRNKIVHLYGDMVDIVDSAGNVIGSQEASDISNSWFIGHAINAIWDAKVTGVYQLNEADEAAKFGKTPGDFKVQDLNGDGKITDADRQFLGYPSPRFHWGLRNEFTFFKDFNLSFMIYSDWGQLGQFNKAKQGNALADRQNAYILPYWTPDNPENSYAKLISSDGGASYNVYRDQSFIRLENISLGYNCPKDLLKKMDIQALTFYLTVRNVAFYAPHWDFWDPESVGPTPRTYTLGLNLTL